MRKLLTIVMILVYNLVLSQTLLEFTMHDSCNDYVLEDFEIQLISLDNKMKEYYLDSHDSTLTVLPNSYLISVAVPDGDNFKSYSFSRQFKADSSYSIRIELPKIIRKYTSAVHYPTDLGFYCCDKICDGLVKDFYRNGKLRIVAEFENGVPIKEIKKYNEKGELIEIQIFDRNGNFKKSKYPNYAEYLRNN